MALLKPNGAWRKSEIRCAPPVFAQLLKAHSDSTKCLLLRENFDVDRLAFDHYNNIGNTTISILVFLKAWFFEESSLDTEELVAWNITRD